MLEYSKNYLNALKRDCQKVNLLFTIISIVATIIYPIVAIILELGTLYINISILSITIIYIIVRLIIGNKKNQKKVVSRVYSWSKILVSTISLAINVYAIYIAYTSANGITIILSTLMIIFWILKIVSNIAYDIFMPRFEMLMECVKADIQDIPPKPIKTITNFISKKINNKEIFNTNEELSEEVKKSSEKAKKATIALKEAEINKNINTNYKDIFENIDVNNDGNIDITEVIIKCLEIDGVLVNKNQILKQELSTKIDKNRLDALIDKGPTKADFSKHELEEYCDEFRKENIHDIEVIKKYLDGELIETNNDNELKKLLKSFSNLLITLQKIIYLYGVKNIKNARDIDQTQLNALIYALGIILNDDNKSKLEEELLKITKFDVKKTIGNISDKVKVIAKKENVQKVLQITGLATTVLLNHPKLKAIGLTAKAVNMAINQVNK